jgi:hypothetical protein
MLLSKRCAQCGERLTDTAVIRVRESLIGERELSRLFCGKCLSESREEDARNGMNEAKATEPDRVFSAERAPQPAGNVNESLRRWR